MPTADMDALVIFGATGDLAKLETFPALVGLVKHGVLDVPGGRGGQERGERPVRPVRQLGHRTAAQPGLRGEHPEPVEQPPGETRRSDDADVQH